ncbi:MAG: heavy-metal-associated domain-containing protein [Firmicutes bacterium]|nr:heavy-metal-associated domain-containing protein [Bacillota bacterium]
MENYIIIAVIILLAIVGIRWSVKHFRGQGGCCGGGTYKVKRKKLKKVAGEKTYTVEGMKCENCKNRVEEAVNDMPGLSGRVSLKKKELTVLYEDTLDEEALRSKLERLGYTLR